MNPDFAVETDTCRVIEGRARRSEGTEANNFKAVYGAWPWAGNFFKRPLKHGACKPLSATDLLPSFRRVRPLIAMSP